MTNAQDGEGIALAAPANAYGNLDVRGAIPEAQKESIRFAFDFPELVAAFEHVDTQANRCKARSGRVGIGAILLVLTALLLSAADPLLRPMGHGVSHLASYVAAGLGTLGTGIALLAFLPGSDRRRWLHNRLQSETLRLFHFGFVVARFPHLIDAIRDPASRTTYLADRRQVLDRLLEEMRTVDQKDAIAAMRMLEGTVYPCARIDDVPLDGRDATPETADALAAWREIRLKRQLDYCDAKLEAGKKAGALNPLRQVQVFAWAGWICIAAVVILHVMHLAGSWLHLSKDWLHVGVMWAALTTLGLRAIEGGLQSDREVERYEQYRANVIVAMERFDAGEELATRIETMRAFERMSLEEMRVFLRTHAKSNFLL